MTTTENDPGRDAPRANVEESSSAAMTPGGDVHADKYNDPRAKITRRGMLIGLGVFSFGVLGAAGSIYQRKTRLTQTRKFWGDDTVLALQLAERIRMEAVCGIEFDPVELTATPGLGHLRHALLDERSYSWESADSDTVMLKCAPANVTTPTEGGECVRLILTDPTAHRFPAIEMIVDLASGWVGPSDGSRSVQTTKRVQPALTKFLKTLITVEQKRSDFRESAS